MTLVRFNIPMLALLTMTPTTVLGNESTEPAKPKLAGGSGIAGHA